MKNAKNKIWFVVLLFVFYLFFKKDESQTLGTNESAEVLITSAELKGNDIKAVYKLGETRKVGEGENPEFKMEARWRTANDLFGLAMEILSKARQGDGEAQYYLYKILVNCYMWNLSDIEVGIEHSPELYLEIIEPFQSRCSGFATDDFDTFNFFENKKTLAAVGSHWKDFAAENGYAPAVLAVKRHNFVRDEITLAQIKIALKSKHPDVFFYMSILASRHTTKGHAWQLLACDYGYDCSATSKEEWRGHSLVFCGVFYSPERCDTSLDYFNILKAKVKESKFDQILERKEWLKEMFESDRSDELTFEQLLD